MTELDKFTRLLAEEFLAFLKKYKSEKQREGLIPTLDLIIEEFESELYGDNNSKNK